MRETQTVISSSKGRYDDFEKNLSLESSKENIKQKPRLTVGPLIEDLDPSPTIKPSRKNLNELVDDYDCL